MAQDYSVEQLNYGRKVHDFMRWDKVAFTLSGLLLIASCLIMGLKGFNWGLDFTGGTVIEITLENRLISSSCAARWRNPASSTRRCRTSAAAATCWFACRQTKAMPVRSWATRW